MLLEAKFFTQIVHQFVVKWFAIIRDDTTWYAISIDDVALDEVYHIFLLYLSKRKSFGPLRKIVSGSQDV